MDSSILFMFLCFGILLVLEVPIAFALAGSALLYVLVYPVVPLTIVVQRMAPGIDSFPTPSSGTFAEASLTAT